VQEEIWCFGTADGVCKAKETEVDPSSLATGPLLARVPEDGVLFGGFGATSSSRVADGVYSVTFNRSIRGCTEIATEAEGPDFIVTVGSERYGGPVEELQVVTYGSTEAPVNSGFAVAVFCESASSQ
jgi:hypothetical protein